MNSLFFNERTRLPNLKPFFSFRRARGKWPLATGRELLITKKCTEDYIEVLCSNGLPKFVNYGFDQAKLQIQIYVYMQKIFTGFCLYMIYTSFGHLGSLIDTRSSIDHFYHYSRFVLDLKLWGAISYDYCR